MAELPDNGLNRRISEQEEVAKECEAIEADIAALRAAYEQYFLGVERHPPTDQHNALKKRFQKLKGMFVRQTALKFRVQSVQGKLSTYERLWSRTLKEIEDGTYRRDLFKAKLRAQKKEKEQKETKPGASHEVVEEIDTDDVLEELPLAAAAAAATAPKSNPTGVPAVPPVAAAGIPAVAPVKSPSGSVPAVAPVKTNPSGVPLVAPVKTNPSGVPLVAPVSSSSGTGIPAVAPVKQGSGSFPALSQAKTNPVGVPAVPSSPGMPAVKSNPLGTPAAKSSPGMPAVRPASSPGVARVAPPSASGDISEAKLKAVYDAYVTAKKRCQEDVSKLSYEQVAANLRKQVPELMKKHNASGVEFKVIIKDGKAVLKAVPK